jgi:outer membrane biosynthesis protein TonB
MGDKVYDVLKKHVQKLSKAITELRVVESELQVILHNKLISSTLIGTEDLENSSSLITKDPKSEILEEALNKDNLNNSVKELEKMLNDDDLWARRIEEHTKIDKMEKKEIKVVTETYNPSINKSNKPDNISGLNEEPLPSQVPKEEHKEEHKNPPINAFTRLSKSERTKILTNVYGDALSAVNSLSRELTEAEKNTLVCEESDKLLEIWIKNN